MSVADGASKFPATSGSAGEGRRQHGRASTALSILALLAAACQSVPPTPSVSPGPSPSASPPAVSAATLALDECDPAGYVPCEHQAATLRIPIAGSGLSLTYSSEWAPGRTDRPPWDPGPLGLGGWSLDVLQRYDASNGVFLAGDSSWRLTKALRLQSGEQVVASYDGRLAYVFDARGRHVRTVDAILGATLLTFTYEVSGRLSGVHGSLGSLPVELSVDRLSDGTLRRFTGAGGSTTSAALDGNGRLAWLGDPAGGGVFISSNTGGLVTSYTDAAGGSTQYSYDNAGRVTSLTDGDGVTRAYDRQASADRAEVRVSTPLKRTQVYRAERDADGLHRTYVAADGATTAMTIDASGRWSVSFPDGRTVGFGLQPDPRFAMQAPLPTPLVETRPDGVERRVEVSETAETTDGELLSLARWSRTTSIDGNTWLEAYDPAARAFTITDPEGRRASYVYDAAGRPVSISRPGQPMLAYAYDESGRLSAETLGSGATAATTRYAYDPTTGLVTVTRPDGTADRLWVDADGRAVRFSAADGSTTQRLNDATGRLVQLRPPGHPSFTLGYSPAGRPTAFLPPVVGDDGSLEMRSYDADGAATAIQGPGERKIAVAYDGAGRPASWQFDQGTTSASYEATSGLLSTLAAPGGITTGYAYTATTPARLTWSGPVSGSVKLTIDAEGRVASESVNSGDLAFAYDRAGLLTGIGSLSLRRDPTSGLAVGSTLGVTGTTRAYDADGLLARETTTAAGTIVLDRRYERDAMRRIVAVTETRAGGPATRTEYGYDDAGRLATVRVDGNLVEEDGYDPAGNRVSVAVRGKRFVAAYDDRDRLQQWRAVNYGYAPDGTLRGRTDGSAVTSYAFDDFGALRGVTLPGGRRIEYLVDGAGWRIGRQVDGRLVAGYLYRPDGQLVAELDGSGSLVARFAYDDLGHLALLERGGRTYRVVTDQLGSPLLVIDAASGQVAESLTYDAWGAMLSDTSPGFVPFGFAGGLRDPDTGLVHFGARDYDPTVGRWTGPDPIRFDGGDPNLYRYAAGDPVNQVDPSGLLNCVETGRSSTCYQGNPPATPPPPPPPPPTPPKRFTCIALTCVGPGGGLQGAGGGVNYYSGSDSGDFTCVGFGCGSPTGAGCFVGYCSYGDPHLRSGDGRRVGFQAAGEFLAIVSPDRRVVVQVRQEPSAGSTLLSNSTAVAVSVDGDRVVGIYLDPKRPLIVGGKVEMRTDVALRLPRGGIVERHGTVVTVDWPDGSRLTVTREGDHFDFGFSPDPTTGSTLTGLLGSADGNIANDLTGRDGVVLDPLDPQFFDKLYRQFGESWRIRQAESLFDYRPGESSATFTIRDLPRAPASLDGLDPGARARATSLCRAVGVRDEPTLSDCIFDVATTGDPSYAASAAAVQAVTRPASAPATGPTPGASPTPGPTPSASPSPRAGGTVAFGESVSGSIGAASQRDHFTFTATAGQIVYLAARGKCGTGLFWRLLGPDGRELRTDYSCTDLGRRGLADDGTYTIEIYSDGTATGPYGFQLLAVPPVRTSAIKVGDTVSDTIGQVGEWHHFTFEATAGQVVYLDGQGSCVDGLLWHVLRPSGGALGLARACDDLGRRVLPEAGTYTIEIYSDGTAIGTYGFQLLAVPPVRTSAIKVGDTVSDTIGQVGVWHHFTFEATAGQVVYLDGQGSCTAGLLWHVLPPDGTALGLAATCDDLGRRVLPDSGTYTIEIYSDGTATGTYRFELRSGP